MESQPFRSHWSFDVSEYSQWRSQLEKVIEVLSSSIGFVSLQLLHSPDEPNRYLVQSTWQDVGSYRRALSATPAKLVVWPFIAPMLDLPSTFETLLERSIDSSIEYPSSVHQS